MFLSSKSKLNELISLLNHHEITLPQLLIIYLVYYQDLSSETRNYLHRTGPLDYKLISDLINKKLITYREAVGKKFELEKAKLTEKGLSIVAEHKTNYGLELWNQYPAFGEINGKKIPLKSANKEAIVSEYNLLCVFNAPNSESFHQNVMNQLKYAINKDSKMLLITIECFIDSSHWELIEEFRQSSFSQANAKNQFG